MKENNMTNKQILKENLIELISESTIHGPSRIIKSKLTITKVIWIICFLVSSFYCCSTVVSSVLDYLNYDYTTSFDYFSEIPAEFPTITICNLNMFQTEYAINYVENYLNIISQNVSDDDAKRFFLLNEIMSKFNSSALQSLSYSLNETILKCKFKGYKCFDNDFEWKFDSIYGNCFRFNTGKDSKGNKIQIKNLTSIGDTYGLHLELFLGDVDLMPEFLRTYGVHIMINNKTINPVPHEGLNLATGKETNVYVDRLFTSRLSYPYNDCLKNLDTLDAYDSLLFRTIVEQNLTYRQFDCFYLCYQQQNSDKCHCQVNNFAKVTNKSSCNTPKEIMCSNDAWNNFLNSDIRGDCSSKCPLECDSNFLSFTVTDSDYPTKAYAKLLMNHTNIKSKFGDSIDYDKLKRSVLSLNVYYEKLGYTIIGEQPKSQIFDLVSSIGGLLGLFLGMSLLSIIEIVEAFIEIISAISAEIKIYNKN